MKGVFFILVSALTGSIAANVGHITSLDQLELTYMPSEDYPLFGKAGSITKLHFKLKNNGEDSRFDIKIRPDMAGERVQEVFVKNEEVANVDFSNILIPEQPAGTIVKIEVEMDSAKKYLIFTIGEAAYEKEPPQIEYYGPYSYHGLTSECNAKPTECRNSTWGAKFVVRDRGVGLQSLDVQTMGRDSVKYPLFYKYDNFAIGSTANVIVIIKASCCVKGVSVTVTDLKGNQYSRDFTHQGNGSTSSTSVATTCAVALLLIIMSNFSSL
ncbi:uncharacterized protein LOC131891575 isoform X2 [Tigriopus californicus]|uniref:uncharacterized protein LOC131891575 isoform X2 n=1 Tax=Tigriopus californicus TaxID=6832 RepID=UPI0027DA63E4|nr:uncharacterized protein LOC131891575 isoform X2 [Tigriopus californicus]